MILVVNLYILLVYCCTMVKFYFAVNCCLMILVVNLCLKILLVKLQNVHVFLKRFPQKMGMGYHRFEAFFRLP